VKSLFLVAVVLSLAYILSLTVHPYPFSFVLKASPIFILAIIGAILLTGQLRLWYLLAMIGSMAGDIFLDVDRQLYLKQALLSFLLTQIGYIVIFNRLSVLKKSSIVSKITSIVAPTLVSLFLLWQFYPNTGALWWPVVIYVFFLTYMAISAIQTGRPWIALGGCLFMAADAMIGINRFWLPFEHSTYVIVSTYISGQLLIAYGLLLADKKVTKWY